MRFVVAMAWWVGSLALAWFLEEKVGFRVPAAFWLLGYIAGMGTAFFVLT